jgi:Tfp pilus assembly pilus retraction ATPase PilT
LAMSLQGVVCQTLCKRSDTQGRVVASEVLVVTPAVRNLIRSTRLCRRVRPMGCTRLIRVWPSWSRTG